MARVLRHIRRAEQYPDRITKPQIAVEQIRLWTREAKKHGHHPNIAYLRARHEHMIEFPRVLIAELGNLRSPHERTRRRAIEYCNRHRQRLQAGARDMGAGFVRGLLQGFIQASRALASSSSSQSVK